VDDLEKDLSSSVHYELSCFRQSGDLILLIKFESQI